MREDREDDTANVWEDVDPGLHVCEECGKRDATKRLDHRGQWHQWYIWLCEMCYKRWQAAEGGA